MKKNNHPKNCLLVGANGRLGRIISKILKDDNELNVIRSAKRKYPGIDFVCDATNIYEIRNFFEVYKPDYVINCAALTDVDMCEKNKLKANKINCAIPELIINNLKKNKFRGKFIQISTDQVYGSNPFSKEDEEAPLNNYGISKLCGDKKTLDYFNSLVIRCNFLWNFDNEGQIYWLREKVQSQLPFMLFEDVICNPLEINYAASIIIEMLKKDLRGIYNLGSRDIMSKAEIFEQVGKLLNLNLFNAKRTSISSARFLAKRPKDMSMNISKLENDLKIQMPSMHETLKMLIN